MFESAELGHKIDKNTYRKAVFQMRSDMVDHTSTGLAPWALVAANDKNYARVKVLRTICERLAAALDATAPLTLIEKNGNKKKGKK